MTESMPVACSFCGKNQDDVRKLIRAPKGDVYICDECVDVCNAVIFGEPQTVLFTLRMALRGLWWRITRRLPSDQDRPPASN